MSFLRTISTRQLMAGLAAIVLVAAGGTAIAIAATGNGPVPQPKPLDVAAHDALTAPRPQGVTARIKFTNHVIDSASLGEGGDPILQGASGRLWLGDGHLRLELQSTDGDAQVVSDGRSFWVYNPRSNTVYRGRFPLGQRADESRPDSRQLPSLAQVQKFIRRLMRHAVVSGAVPGDIAGRPAYTVRVSPKRHGGLVGAGELAWDALRGVPLDFSLFAKGNDAPVLELTATDISYGPVPAAAFEISPPPDAKVVELSGSSARGSRNEGDGNGVPVTGRAAVAKAVPFTLSAPGALGPRPRSEVRLLDWGDSKATLLTYGRDLDGIAVIEQAAEPGNARSTGGGPSSDGDGGGLGLPEVSINGASGEELATALGTMVRFERDGVAYTVVGSLPPATIEAAARAL